MKFNVLVKLIEVYEMEIEADSEEEALSKGDQIMESPYKYQYHSDSDVEMTAFEV